MFLSNNSLVLTRHAERRAKERGLPWRIISAICANSDRQTPVGGGCVSLMVSRSELQDLAGSISADDRERMQGVAVVVDAETETVVTVLHVNRRNGSRYRRQRSRRGHRVRTGRYFTSRPETLPL
jgi:hypothetical protein